MDQQTLKSLVEQTAWSKLRKSSDPPTMTPNWIERDGRKQKSVIRQLTEEGYLSAAKCEDGQVVLTPRAWDEFPECQPDLFNYWQQCYVNYDKFVDAVPFRSLDLAEQKYVLSRPQEYQFYLGDVWRGEGQLQPFTPGSGEYEELTAKLILRSDTQQPYVSSAGLKEQVGKFLRDKEVDKLYRSHLFEGLKHLGILPKDAEKFFEVTNSPFQGINFSANPDKWEGELEDLIKDGFRRLASIQTNLQRLVNVQAGVYHYGGWKKFLENYRAAVESHVEGKQGDKGEGEQATNTNP